MSTHTPERLRCEVCDLPTLGDTLCNLHYEERENATMHTPGPWEVTYSTNFPDQQTVQAEGSYRILALIDRADEQDYANARLIAAAPDLLETVKNLVNLASVRGRLDDYKAALNDAKALIAKAEGRG